MNLEKGISFEVCTHLLKRIDLGAEAGYNDFIREDERLDSYPLQEMSNLTKAIMGNIDYDLAKYKRLSNFNYLKSKLSIGFNLSMKEDDVLLVFPLLIEGGDQLRKKLINNKIFCATYWPNVIEELGSSFLENYYTKNIISIPIDQR